MLPSFLSKKTVCFQFFSGKHVFFYKKLAKPLWLVTHLQALELPNCRKAGKGGWVGFETWNFMELRDVKITDGIEKKQGWNEMAWNLLVT